MGNMSTKTLTETFLFLDCLSDLQGKNPDQDTCNASRIMQVSPNNFQY